MPPLYVKLRVYSYMISSILIVLKLKTWTKLILFLNEFCNPNQISTKLDPNQKKCKKRSTADEHEKSSKIQKNS